MRDIDELFAALSKSRFRSRFTLSDSDRQYAARKTPATIRDHARKFVLDRLAPPAPPNDGRQTPMQGHPVFRAQHATATCCRKCLAKWHGIQQGRALTDEEVDYVVRVIDRWVSLQISRERDSPPRQLPLFPPNA
jgi:hypothetical protein